MQFEIFSSLLLMSLREMFQRQQASLVDRIFPGEDTELVASQETEPDRVEDSADGSVGNREEPDKISLHDTEPSEPDFEVPLSPAQDGQHPIYSLGGDELPPAGQLIQESPMSSDDAALTSLIAAGPDKNAGDKS